MFFNFLSFHFILLFLTLQSFNDRKPGEFSRISFNSKLILEINFDRKKNLHGTYLYISGNRAKEYKLELLIT